MTEEKGLKKLRNTPNMPLTLCSNCKCYRYGACFCKIKEKKSQKHPLVSEI